MRTNRAYYRKAQAELAARNTCNRRDRRQAANTLRWLALHINPPQTVTDESDVTETIEQTAESGDMETAVEQTAA